MRFGDAFFITTFSILFIELTSPINLKEDKCSAFYKNLWHQGTVPYAIAHHFRDKDLNLIKEALVDIMNTTCIKFVPHTNEPDLVVFVEYRHPNQERGTCWSGYKWNNGSSSIGKQKGWHIVSLWRDLECFNKWDIIRQISNILGVQANPSKSISKYRKSIIYGAYLSYEEDFGTEQQKKRNVFIEMCENESKFLSKYRYAVDKKEWLPIAKIDTCSVMRNMIQINRIYNCSTYKAPISDAGNNPINIDALDYVRPNCKAAAETGACKSDPVYMKNIACDNVCLGWGVAYGIASPRRANLINGFGKCVNVDPQSHSGLGLQQSNCDPNDKTMLWSWNEVTLGSKDRHICNGHEMCVATPADNANNELQIAYYHSDEHAQRFYLLDSLVHPGFYVIKNDHGKCLSVQGNRDQTGAQIWSNDCNPSEAGQRWKWGWAVSPGIPSPNRANLINGFGNCISEDSDTYLYQRDCDPSNDGMLWSWNQVSLGSRDRHLCNGKGYCAASFNNVDYSIHLFTFNHLDEHGQRFLFSDSLTHPGFYAIKNDHGKCLSVNGNTNQTGAPIWVNDCSPLEEGQRWKWRNM